MKILALEHEVPGTPPEQFKAHLKHEAARVWALTQAGILRETYFRQDRAEAVLVLECADATEAQAVLSTLPLVQAGLITFEVIPLVPYPGLARLFAQTAQADAQ
jgi:muconolactone delta-isomerase